MKYKAIVKFFTYEEGGRVRPPLSGFRPQLRIGNESTSTTVKLADCDVEEAVMEFGKEHVVYLELMFEDMYREKLNAILKSGNKDVELYEGNKLVGKGTMIDY